MAHHRKRQDRPGYRLPGRARRTRTETAPPRSEGTGHPAKPTRSTEQQDKQLETQPSRPSKTRPAAQMSSSASVWARPSAGPPPWTGTAGRSMTGSQGPAQPRVPAAGPVGAPGRAQPSAGGRGTSPPLSGPWLWRSPGTRASRWATCPGASVRRVADLTPGAARTDKRDAAVTAQAARTMPHTLRAVSISDEDTAALSMLTGPDLDPARQDRPDPAPPSRWSRGHDQPATPCWKSLPPDAAPTALRKAGKAHIGARLKKHGARRRAARASETVSVPEKQTVTVAGTDAAGTVLPHLARRLISLHSQRAEHRDRARGPGGRLRPLLPSPHHPCPGSGSRPRPSSWPRHWAGPSTPAPNRPHTPAWRR